MQAVNLLFARSGQFMHLVSWTLVLKMFPGIGSPRLRDRCPLPPPRCCHCETKHTAKRRLVVREKAYDSTLSPLFGCFQCFCQSRWLACAAGLENITASPPPLLTSTQRTPTFSLLLHHFRCRPRLPFQPREIQLPPKALRKFLPLLT